MDSIMTYALKYSLSVSIPLEGDERYFTRIDARESENKKYSEDLEDEAERRRFRSKTQRIKAETRLIKAETQLIKADRRRIKADRRRIKAERREREYEQERTRVVGLR
jgi:hypothetical protein